MKNKLISILLSTIICIIVIAGSWAASLAVKHTDILDTSNVLYTDVLMEDDDPVEYTEIYTKHPDGSVALARHVTPYGTLYFFNKGHKVIAYSKDLKFWQCIEVTEPKSKLFDEEEGYLSNIRYGAYMNTFNPESCK